jgi:hypothetical protein
MSQILPNAFYILVEGKPTSPEIKFLNEAIGNIFEDNDINFSPQIFEVGSSSAFHSVAKTFYSLSEKTKQQTHKNIPVLAICDNDYRIRANAYEKSVQIIADKRAKILYWQRNEWENYLLDEIDIIVDLINQQKAAPILTTQIVNNFLEDYFKKSVFEEYWECLKFNLSFKIHERPSIQKPEWFDGQDFTEIEKWFTDTINNPPEFTSKPEFQINDLYQAIMQEYNWQCYITESQSIPFDSAKINFRGKEAFKKLVSYINQNSNLKLDEKKFKVDVLKNLHSDSKIYQDLEILLLNELKSGVEK